MRFLWVLSLVAFLSIPLVESFAGAGGPAAGGPTPPPVSGPAGSPTPPTGSGCSWDAIKDSIAGTESDDGCAERDNPTYIGKYQFGVDTWNGSVANCPNASACPWGSNAFFDDPACCVVQECAMDNLLAANMQSAANIGACQAILGKTITAPQSWVNGVRTNTPVTCTVTMSGILGAMHLGGTDACDGPASGGYGDDDCKGSCVGTYEASYICKHSGYPVPAQGGTCTYPSVTPGTAPVAGTAQQVTIQTAHGGLQLMPGPLDPLKQWWILALQMMAEQFSINMMAQVEAFGMLLDAKHQLETQRLFQEKLAQAHKDYQVSEQMCTIGTFTQDLAATQRQAEVTKLALNAEILQGELASGDTKGQTPTADNFSRLSKYRAMFCDPDDLAGGLKFFCPSGAPKQTQNMDINFTQTIDQPLSLKVDMTDGTVTPDEESIFALIDNLFAHETPSFPSEAKLKLEKYQYHYMNYRSIVAMRGIARNSIANIIAMKTESPFENTDPGSAPYMKSLMREFGLTDTEIQKLLGEHPSYHAQMEVLTKKIYQNPVFYTELYDKPANVKRIRAAMRAIKLMQDRDIQLALQRREMLLSMMLELRLRERADSVYNATNKSLFNEQF